MKYGKILYLIAVIIMAAMSAVFLNAGMGFLGFIFSITTFSAIVNYISLEEMNEELYSEYEKQQFLNTLYSKEKQEKKKRELYFNKRYKEISESEWFKKRYEDKHLN